MKKIIVSMFCSTVLLSTLGSSIAHAEEVTLKPDIAIEALQSVNIEQTRGTINGKYYRFTAVFKNVPPYKYRGGTKVHHVRNHQGLWIGYYR
ncbi:hypothetical protein [Vagococcus hydrophili]|uniref:Uncharacterized protein n=1 Tax=Vagococcus hydrophili TaxID=2714947 RepID=A0A6G8ARZ4_9ENTE|nr:hypothetical protein [Vagococcus hydrophili]QIL47834.1 hypothetical protein G7082_04380 [Vagococcus hydrophili]